MRHRRHRRGGAPDSLDLPRATAYLVERNNDAGILASLAHPDVIVALSSRSMPTALVLAFRHSQTRDLLEQTPFQPWLRET